MKSKPNVTATIGTNFRRDARTLGVINSDVNATVKRTGAVPKPNEAINSAPEVGESCATEPASARYTKPHGKKPLIIPTAKFAPTERSANNAEIALRSGCTKRERRGVVVKFEKLDWRNKIGVIAEIIIILPAPIDSPCCQPAKAIFFPINPRIAPRKAYVIILPKL